MPSMPGRSLSLWFVLLQYFAFSSGLIYWDREVVSVRQGATTSVVCLATGTNPLSVTRLFKRESAGTYPISDNGDLKPPFLNSGRYHLQHYYEPAMRRTSVTMTLIDVRGEDAGEIGCVCLDGDDSAVFLTLKVQATISALYFVARELDGRDYVLRDGAEVALIEGEETSVTCVAVINGSVTSPTMRMFVDGVNRTDVFSATRKVVTSSPKGDQQAGSNGRSTLALESRAIQANLTYRSAMPDPSFNDKEIICEASAGDGSSVARVRAFLDVEFTPILTCHNYEYYAIPGESLSLECDVRSNPGSSIKWTYGAFHHDAILITSNDNFFIVQNAISQDHARLVLMVRKVGRENLTRYYLEARNDLGISQVEIVVHQGALPMMDEPAIHFPGEMLPQIGEIQEKPHDPKHVNDPAIGAISATGLASGRIKSNIVFHSVLILLIGVIL